MADNKTKFTNKNQTDRKRIQNLSDLAVEFADDGEGVLCSEIKYSSFGDEVFEIEEIKIETETAANRLSRERGRYINISCPTRLSELSDGGIATLIKIIRENIAGLLRDSTNGLDGKLTVLIVGLGNREITADSLGIRCAERITPSSFSSRGSSKAEVCVLVPGTQNASGIETSEMVAAIASRTGAHVVIVIDALSAGSTERLFTTFQMTDSGIRPGSGSRVRTRAINQELLGVPTIAIGMPTVIALSEVIGDALELLGVSEDENPEELAEILGSGNDWLVSLAESDVMVNVAAIALSEAIESALKIE